MTNFYKFLLKARIPFLREGRVVRVEGIWKQNVWLESHVLQVTKIDENMYQML